MLPLLWIVSFVILRIAAKVRHDNTTGHCVCQVLYIIKYIDQPGWLDRPRHQTEGYDVHRNRPRKIDELTEDATSAQGEYVKITTKKLINGKWRTWVKREKVDENYK